MPTLLSSRNEHAQRHPNSMKEAPVSAAAPTETTAPASPPTRRSRRTRRPVGQRVLLGLAAALAAGLVAGLAARALMRLATLAVGGDTGFSVAGTAMIVVIFVVTALPGAVARAQGARRTAAALLTLGSGFVAFECVAIGTQDLAEVELAGTTLTAVIAIAAGFAVVVVAQALLAWRFAAAMTAERKLTAGV